MFCESDFFQKTMKKYLNGLYILINEARLYIQINEVYHKNSCIITGFQ